MIRLTIEHMKMMIFEIKDELQYNHEDSYVSIFGFSLVVGLLVYTIVQSHKIERPTFDPRHPSHRSQLSVSCERHLSRNGRFACHKLSKHPTHNILLCCGLN